MIAIVDTKTNLLGKENTVADILLSILIAVRPRLYVSFFLFYHDTLLLVVTRTSNLPSTATPLSKFQVFTSLLCE